MIFYCRISRNGTASSYDTDYCSDLPVRADPGVGAIRK
jgi:hypothetical protein